MKELTRLRSSISSKDIDVVILFVVVIISPMHDIIVKQDPNGKTTDRNALTTDGSGREE